MRTGARILLNAAAGVILLAVLASCGATRRVPQGKYLLVRNKIEVDKEVSRQVRIKSEDVEPFIRQTPNRKFLGTNLYLGLYNMADPDKDNWINRSLRSMGEAPVILDTMLTRRSGESMKTYMSNHGFFYSDYSYRVDSTRKKAKVTYSLRQGPYFLIGNVDYEFRDQSLQPILRRDSANTLLRRGKLLDLTVLDEERARIANYLKDNGYYYFSARDNIGYVVDTLAGDGTADVTMIVRPYLADYTTAGEPVYENNSIYRLSEIFVNPAYDPVRAANDPAWASGMDTIDYRGLKILSPEGEKLRVRRRILRQTIDLYPNYIYNASQVQQTYANIMRLGFFRNASIIFEPLKDDGRAGRVTFIGSDENAPGATTTERRMLCRINCIPAMRQSYKIELEGTTSSNFYGISATVGYQNRSLFRGVELFDASVKFGYEYVRTQGKKNSYELGGAVAIYFPRFVTPWNVDRYNRAVNPRTRFELSVNAQRRPMYHRIISSVNWGYSWSDKNHNSFIVRPIDLNLIKLNYLDEAYYDQLQNPYLKKSFESRLLPGISGAYTFNTQQNAIDITHNSTFLRLNWETAGNLADLLTSLFSNRSYTEDGEKYYKIFGIRYAQYARADISFSQRIVVAPRTNVAYRLYAGVSGAYGNDDAVPYDRLFYCGGSNSMRGWVARTLGPGEEPYTSSQYPSQLGEMKLEANLELRFPVWKRLLGAVFFDAGNVWYINQGSYAEDGVFNIDTFYKQLGFNTGLGARIDVNFAVLRFDLGLKLHDPNQPMGQRWISGFRFSDTVLNFGVGYPF